MVKNRRRSCSQPCGWLAGKHVAGRQAWCDSSPSKCELHSPQEVGLKPTSGIERSRAPAAARYELWCVDDGVKGGARPKLRRLHIQAACAAEWRALSRINEHVYSMCCAIDALDCNATVDLQYLASGGQHRFWRHADVHHMPNLWHGWAAPQHDLGCRHAPGQTQCPRQRCAAHLHVCRAAILVAQVERG